MCMYIHTCVYIHTHIYIYISTQLSPSSYTKKLTRTIIKNNKTIKKTNKK